jgi:predicted AAA+ superfamily ATPase
MYINRIKYETEIIEGFKNTPIIVLMGPRQVGKTMLMDNVNLKENKIRLNGQDTDTGLIFSSYGNLKNFLISNLNKDLTGYILIDEFQYLYNISTILKILVDENKGIKVICTGSSSLDINQKVEESLTGRIRTINIHPLSFEEFLKFKNEEVYNIYLNYDLNTNDEIVSQTLKFYFSEFLVYGGLPKVSLENNPEEKIRLLKDIYQTYLIRDVKNYIETKNTVGFNKLLKLLANQISSLISINELSRSSELKYHLCSEYIYLLEQMYIIKPLPPFSGNKRNIISKHKKLYLYDNGIRNIIYGDFNNVDIRNDNGKLFENAVFNELDIKKGLITNLYFYRKMNLTEIDFIIEKESKLIIAESKFKFFRHPVVPKSYYGFSEEFQVKEKFLINKNLNTDLNDVKFIQGYLTGKLDI